MHALYIESARKIITFLDDDDANQLCEMNQAIMKACESYWTHLHNLIVKFEDDGIGFADTSMSCVRRAYIKVLERYNTFFDKHGEPITVKDTDAYGISYIFAEMISRLHNEISNFLLKNHKPCDRFFDHIDRIYDSRDNMDALMDTRTLKLREWNDKRLGTSDVDVICHETLYE